MVEIIFVDLDYEEIERSTLSNVTLKEAIDIIDKVSEFKVGEGEDRMRLGKAGWISVDLFNNEIEVQLNLPG